MAWKGSGVRFPSAPHDKPPTQRPQVLQLEAPLEVARPPGVHVGVSGGRRSVRPSGIVSDGFDHRGDVHRILVGRGQLGGAVNGGSNASPSSPWPGVVRFIGHGFLLIASHRQRSGGPGSPIRRLVRVGTVGTSRRVLLGQAAGVAAAAAVAPLAVFAAPARRVILSTDINHPHGDLRHWMPGRGRESVDRRAARLGG